MNKQKAKRVLHWIGFVAVIAAAAYIAFVAKGLDAVERLTLAASTLGGLFVALGKVLPSLDKAVDSLPDDCSNVVELPPRDKQSGHVLPAVVFVVLFLAAATFVALTLFPSTARAADIMGRWTQAWTVGAPTSIRLDKAGGIAVADQGCTCYSLTYQPLRVGGDACICLRISSTHVPNAYTTAIGAHYRNAGFALGLLKEPDAAWVPVLQLTGQVALLGGM